MSENTPNKPPRKKLELGVDSPNQGRKSNSPNMVGGGNSQRERGMPQVQAYQASEVSSVAQAPKYMAKPLGGPGLNSPASLSSSSGSFVGTVVQRPASLGQTERSIGQASEEGGNRTSVKDRVKNIEVFALSPGSSTPNVQDSVHPDGEEEKHMLSAPREQSIDILELLESTTRNDSLNDKLRPVVKKAEVEQSEEITPSQASSVSHMPSTDSGDNVNNMPPMVPNRTYKQQTGWKDQYSHRGPTPRDSKSNSNANIHSPLGQNSLMNSYKLEPTGEPKRSPSQSKPEPQVPSRSRHSSRGSDPHTRDQNANISSQDSRTAHHSNEHVQNKENTQVHPSVHSGQKRNYDKSFSRTRHSSGGSSNSSTLSDPHSLGSYQNSRQGNTHSDKQMGGNSHSSSDIRGDNFSEQNHTKPYEQRSPKGQVAYNQSPTQRHRVPDQSQSKSPNTHAINQSPASIQRNEPIEMKPNPCVEANNQTMLVVNHVRQPSAEELECDQKAQELAKVLKDSDKELCNVLNSESKKSRMQYLDGIFPTSMEAAEERRPRSATKSDKPAEEKPEVKEE